MIGTITPSRDSISFLRRSRSKIPRAISTATIRCSPGAIAPPRSLECGSTSAPTGPSISSAASIVSMLGQRSSRVLESARSMMLARARGTVGAISSMGAISSVTTASRVATRDSRGKGGLPVMA